MIFFEFISPAFYLGAVFAILVGSPFAGYFIHKYFKSNKNFIQIIFVFIFSLFALILLNLNNISFINIYADLILPSALYLTFCTLAHFIFHLKQTFFVSFVKTILFIPIAVIIFSSTFGIIGVMLAIGSNLPEKIQNLNNEFYYKDYYDGGALADEDFRKIKIYKKLNYFNFLEKEVYSRTMSYLHYDIMDVMVKFTDYNKFYNLQIYSKDKIQIDTLISKDDLK